MVCSTLSNKTNLCENCYKARLRGRDRILLIRRNSRIGPPNRNDEPLSAHTWEQTTMVRGITVLLVCQLAGEVTARALNLPAPGPVLGMLLLFGMLLWRGAPDWLDQVGQGLLRFLPLFFVPAGVGIMNHVQLMRAEWLAIAVTLLVSTVITMIVTAGALLLLLRLTAGREASRNATNHD